MSLVVPRCTSQNRDLLACGARLVAVPYIDRVSGKRRFALLCPYHDSLDRIPSMTGRMNPA